MYTYQYKSHSFAPANFVSVCTRFEVFFLSCLFLSFLLDLITLFTFYRGMEPFRVLCISSIKAARMLLASKANMPLVF